MGKVEKLHVTSRNDEDQVETTHEYEGVTDVSEDRKGNRFQAKPPGKAEIISPELRLMC
jgi:hypothetical protein